MNPEELIEELGKWIDTDSRYADCAVQILINGQLYKLGEVSSLSHERVIVLEPAP